MPFLPICKEDLEERGIEQLDFIVVSGDAYVDHHSFGHAVIARLTEAQGFSVGILAQPVADADYLALGRPKCGFLVTSGVVDSMVNNYTVAKRRRSTDDYSPGGRAGRRPDRALTVYCRKLKQLFPGAPIAIGGIEASLRRFAHYDYWSDTVMPSILHSTMADILIYGMGERPLLDLLKLVGRGVPLSKIRDVRGTAYLADYDSLSARVKANLERGIGDYLLLPGYAKVKSDKRSFAEAFRTQSRNTDSINGAGLIQEQEGGRYLVQNRPAALLSEAELDAVYALPFMRSFHPSYCAAGGVPAIEEVKFSITSHRGCFGSCSFCALNYHQGRVIQRRSEQSVVEEAERIAALPDFKGYIHDVGGPTANFRNPACEKQRADGVCKNRYCIGTTPCKNLKVDHSQYLRLLQRIRKVPGVKRVFIRSGVRFDYAMYDPNPQFIDELVKYHVSGQLKVAPEHISDRVLSLMNKPSSKVYLSFAKRYAAANARLKKEQYLVPYFISSHPGCTLADAIELSLYLKSIRYMPQQVQDFYPTPSTRSTCMFYTGLDPDTMKEVYVPRDPEEKAMQRALLQYRKKENYQLIRRALLAAGRSDLIGFSEGCLIKPLRESARQREAAKNSAKSGK